LERLHVEEGKAAGRWNGVEDGRELSKDRVAQQLMDVNSILAGSGMVAGYLTQWGTSWPRERVCGRGGIRKNCGNLWKSQRPCL